MFGRIAELLGFRKEKDEALAKRFARIRQLYGEAGGTTSEERALSVVTHMRTGYNLRTVVGAEKASGELLRKNLLESYARTAKAAEPVGSK